LLPEGSAKAVMNFDDGFSGAAVDPDLVIDLNSGLASPEKQNDLAARASGREKAQLVSWKFVSASLAPLLALVSPSTTLLDACRTVAWKANFLRLTFESLCILSDALLIRSNH
jgi:hypothetical protein